MNTLYQHVLHKFPHKHIKFAFAYGSGVFEQLESNKSDNMIDFVFVVDDAIKFHDANLRLNSSHYSFLRYLGPYYVSRVQSDLGAACYYNTLVNLKLDDTSSSSSSQKTCLMKYGVITEEAMIRDLYDWQYLYICGRLHKPVKIIKRSASGAHSAARFASAAQTAEQAKKDVEELPENFSLEHFHKSLDLALQTNLQNALHTSLLLLPEKFTLEELFLQISQLSYSGDLRMVVGENKQKVFNIVRPQMSRFTDLYKPYLIKAAFEKHVACNFDTGRVEQCASQATVHHHLNQLPKHVLETIVWRQYSRAHYHDLEEYILKLTRRVDYRFIVEDAVQAIVKYTSTVQAAKGVLTAGVFKTVDYSWRKLKKMFKR